MTVELATMELTGKRDEATRCVELSRSHYVDSKEASMTTKSIHSRLSATLMLCLLFVAGTNNALAQEEAARFCRSAIYFEAFGQGVLYSVNYDHRITQHIGVRAGFSSWSIPIPFLVTVGELEFTSFPIMLNYLTGEGSSHLELGIGVMPTSISFLGREIIFGSEVDGQGTPMLGTATLGYRFQASEGGLVFRIGLTPWFTTRESMLFGGASIGFAF